MRQVGHASKEISQRYIHPLRQAHLEAAAQAAGLVSKAAHEQQADGCSRLVPDGRSASACQRRDSELFSRWETVGRVGLEPTTGGL